MTNSNVGVYQCLYNRIESNRYKYSHRCVLAHFTNWMFSLSVALYSLIFLKSGTNSGMRNKEILLSVE